LSLSPYYFSTTVVAAILDSGVNISAAMTSLTTSMYGMAIGFKTLEVLVPVVSPSQSSRAQLCLACPILWQ